MLRYLKRGSFHLVKKWSGQHFTYFVMMNTDGKYLELNLIVKAWFSRAT